MKAIDLYSGVGGWTLGLELAGIEVIRCYEWWDRALETYNSNLNPVAMSRNIRKLKPQDIDVDQVDIIVGSPPCTQFSYANRGGKGDIADGLTDIAKFLEIVSYFKPKYWAMENVPRVARIIENEISKGGQLEKFASLIKTNSIVDMSEFGLPQRRKRMIAGDFPIELLQTYKNQLPERTLGEVLYGLNDKKPVDPIYGFTVSNITEMEQEHTLDEEEFRLNKEAKRHHPVYNRMPFPDSLNRPSRTVTALCTRVSRESIVVPDLLNKGNYRRLSVRERASLQGFPINYQFFGKSHAEKIKLIGNAIPPLMSFYWAKAIQNVAPEKLPDLREVEFPDFKSADCPPITIPRGVGRKFPNNRSFRIAIVNLRFGSGMRFELSNSKGSSNWETRFIYGNSRNIKSIDLGKKLFSKLQKSNPWPGVNDSFNEGRADLINLLCTTDRKHLQAVWTRRESGVGPFEICDRLGRWSKSIADNLMKGETEYVKFVLSELGFDQTASLSGTRKISINAAEIFAGMIVACWMNTEGKQVLEPKRSAA